MMLIEATFCLFMVFYSLSLSLSLSPSPPSSLSLYRAYFLTPLNVLQARYDFAQQHNVSAPATIPSTLLYMYMYMCMCM